MRDWKIILPILVVVAFVIVGVFQIYRSQIVTKRFASAPPSPQAEKFPSVEEAAVSPNASVLATRQPDTGSETTAIENIGIFIDLPTPDSQIASPVKIAGRANVLGNLQILIKDENGHILGSGTVTACLGYDACPFETTVNFTASSTQSGVIEVSNPSTFDGTQKYLQKIPIIF